MGYFKEVVKGVSWMGGLRGYTRGIAFVKIAILARILTPLQFGLFGIASLILAFLETLTETGINIFFIQKEGRLDDYIDTAWIVSIIRGFLISVVIIIFAKAISIFFSSPDSKILIYLISLVPLLRGFINPARVSFRMNLEFNKEFLLQAVIFTVNAIVTLAAAYITKSAASFIWGMLAGVLVEIGLSFVVFKHKPKLTFEFNKAKRVISRGKWVATAQTANMGFETLDDVFVGRLLNASNLGIYQVAYKISTLPLTEIGKVVGEVTFPVYSRIGKDLKRLKKAFIKVITSVTLLTVPLGIIFFLYPEQIILLLLGNQWLSAAPVLKVLAIFGVARALIQTSYPVFLTNKKQEYVAYLCIISLLGMLITIYPLIKNFGIIGAAYSALNGLILSIPFAFYFIVRVLKIEKENG